MTEYSWWICLLLGHIWFLQYTDTEELNACSNASIRYNTPVVTFCKNSQAVGTFLVMDGYYANSVPEEKNCSCLIQISLNTRLFFNRATFAPDEISAECGSEITVTHNNGGVKMECNGSDIIVDGYSRDHINVLLRKKNHPEDTRYCFYINQGNGNASINVTCSSNKDSIGPIQTPDMFASTEHTSRNTILTGSTDVASTDGNGNASNNVTCSSSKDLTGPIQTPDMFASTEHTSRNSIITASPDFTSTGGSIPENSATVYYYVGGGGSAVVIIMVLLLTLILCRRRSFAKDLGKQQENEDEEDELKYNVLYVSSQNTENERKTNSDAQNVNKREHNNHITSIMLCV